MTKKKNADSADTFRSQDRPKECIHFSDLCELNLRYLRETIHT